MVVSKQAGFTLIEIIIVLAIAGVLMIMVFNGLQSTRAQAEFESATEQMKESVSARREEAIASINPNVGAGVDQTTVVYGNMLEFNPGSSDVKVLILKTGNQDNPICGTPASKVITEDINSSFTLKWQLIFSGTHKRYIAFTHSLLDNSLQTVVHDETFNTLNMDYCDFNPGQGIPGLVQELPFVDAFGRASYLQVNTSNGGISRRYQ